MQGKVCVVTGANSGIGKSLATSLAKRGAEVVMVCRDPVRGEAARREVVEAAGNQNVSLMGCDVGEMASVRAFVDEWKATRGRIDVLCNNAGVLLSNRTMTKEGIEATFAINHLGMFLLTNLLLDRLQGARVIATSSMAHYYTNWDVETLENPKFYVGMLVYGNSKLCNILFTRELAKRHGDVVHASCFHPGPVGTGFAQDDAGLMNVAMKLGKLFLLTSDQGADTGLYLATEEEGAKATGGYYAKRKLRRTSAIAKDDAVAARLWERSVELSGLG